MQLSYKWKILIVALLSTFPELLLTTLSNIALPTILTDFNEPLDKAQFITSAFMLALAISGALAAYLSTKFGIKRVILAGESVMLITLVLCGLAWNINALIVFRIIQGLASGFLLPIAMLMIFSSAAKEEQGKMMSGFGVSQVLAPSIGLALGGYLVEALNWRWCFYVNIPMVLLALFFTMKWVEDTPHDSGLYLDKKGLVLTSIGLSTLLIAFSYAASWGWDDTRIVVLFTISAISIILLVIVERQEIMPLLALQVFKYKNYILGSIVMMFCILVMYYLMLLMPLFLQNLQGISSTRSGLLLVPMALCTAIGSITGGLLYDKIGARIPIIIGALIVAGSLWQFTRLDMDTASSSIMLITSIAGIGTGLAIMPATTGVLGALPGQLTNQGSTINRVLYSVFGAMGSAIFASLLSSNIDTNLAILTQTVTLDSAATLQALSSSQVLMQQAGLSLQAAYQYGLYILYQQVALEASILSFNKIFVISTIIVFIVIIPALFFTNHAGKKEEAAMPH